MPTCLPAHPRHNKCANSKLQNNHQHMTYNAAINTLNSCAVACWMLCPTTSAVSYPMLCCAVAEWCCFTLRECLLLLLHVCPLPLVPQNLAWSCKQRSNWAVLQIKHIAAFILQVLASRRDKQATQQVLQTKKIATCNLQDLAWHTNEEAIEQLLHTKQATTYTLKLHAWCTNQLSHWAVKHLTQTKQVAT